MPFIVAITEYDEGMRGGRHRCDKSCKRVTEPEIIKDKVRVELAVDDDTPSLGEPARNLERSSGESADYCVKVDAYGQ